MKRIRVTTGSRLHFGLVRLPPAPEWTDDGERYFGGAGLMIAAPGTSVCVEPADAWSAAGPLSERALAAGRRFAAATNEVGPARIVVERSTPEHYGMGTGTQLELAVAAALGRATGRDDDAVSLARLIGRGKRSAIGVHGFDRGGFLVDAGKRMTSEIAPLADRVDFAPDWRVVLIAGAAAGAWYGPRELDAFAMPPDRATERIANRLHDLIANALTPALRARNFPVFGTALGEFNTLSGELFWPVQGGMFASQTIADFVAWLRSEGIRGAGQSSWGPTVYAIVRDADEADALAKRIGAKFGAIATVTHARNHGAQIEEWIERLEPRTVRARRVE